MKSKWPKSKDLKVDLSNKMNQRWKCKTTSRTLKWKQTQTIIKKLAKQKKLEKQTTPNQKKICKSSMRKKPANLKAIHPSKLILIQTIQSPNHKTSTWSSFSPFWPNKLESLNFPLSLTYSQFTTTKTALTFTYSCYWQTLS